MDPYKNMTEAELRAARKLSAECPLAWCRMSEKLQKIGHEHTHPHYQIYYVRRGSARFYADANALHLTQGDCVILTPNEVHRIVPEKDASVTAIMFYMQIFPPLLKDEPLLQRFFAAINSTSLPHKLNLSAPELLYLDQLAYFMNDEDEKEQEGYKNVLLCSLTLIITLLSRAYFRQQKPSKHTGAMLETLEYIRTHFSQNLTGAELARRMFLSESTFYRAFRRMTGRSFQEYLAATRIRHACKLLREKSLPLSAVAAECGYNDYSVFYRAFVSAMQLTPSDYRRRDLPAEISAAEI